MIILCLGCSYTAGMPSDYYNWAESLSILNPEYKVYNLAVGGASLLFSLHLLDEFTKILTPDKIIFQITNPHRITFTGEFTLNSESLIKSKNYYRLPPNIRLEKNILTITPADTLPRWTTNYKKIKFAKEYYKYYNKKMGLLEHNILIETVKKKSDFSFEYDMIPFEARKNVIDEAGHFSRTGHNLIAEWIKHELERNLY